MPTQVVVSGADDNTCPVGYEKLYPKFGMRGHNGLDLMAGEQYVYAAADGVVVEIQMVPARGLGVGVLTNEQFDLNEHGRHFAKVRYWHLKTILVSAGQSIKIGDIIGISDSTGYSSGNHLHFEVQPMDKDSGGHPYIPNLPYTIAGAIDPEPYFVGFYADEQAKVISTYQKLIALLIEFLKQKQTS